MKSSKGPSDVNLSKDTEQLTSDFLFEFSIQSILKKHKNVSKSFILMNDKKLVQTNYNMEIGYDIYQFENKTEDKIYNEELEIPGNTGITLCRPQKPNSYKIAVKPKSVYAFVYR